MNDVSRLGRLADARLAVTGGTGRLGRRLLAALGSVGARDVRLLVHRTPVPDDVTRNLRVEAIPGDVQEAATMARLVAGCDLVFHLAGQSDAQSAGSIAGEYVRVNQQGTEVVAAACSAAGVRGIVYSSTGQVYGRPLALPVSEDHVTAPLAGYAASKLAGEAVLRAHAGRLGVGIARLSNLYGGGAGPETVVARALEHVARGEPITLRNLDAVRDFLYIDDAVEALVLLADEVIRSGSLTVVNVGTGEATSVKALVTCVQAVAAELGREAVVAEQPAPAAPEAIPVLVLDSGRLRRLTGWMPRTPLATGLKLALAERLDAAPSAPQRCHA